MNILRLQPKTRFISQHEMFLAHQYGKVAKAIPITAVASTNDTTKLVDISVILYGILTCLMAETGP